MELLTDSLFFYIHRKFILGKIYLGKAIFIDTFSLLSTIKLVDFSVLLECP